MSLIKNSSVFSSFFKNIFKKDAVKTLGRWKIERDTKEDLKILYANYDSCGDKLCGNPKSLKQNIDLILNKKTDDKDN